LPVEGSTPRSSLCGRDFMGSEAKEIVGILDEEQLTQTEAAF
jgi:hypothetical protein